MTTVLRLATADDAAAIGLLHADSWRRHYRGAYADSFLDGDVVADREATWAARLSKSAGTITIVAEDGQDLAGFVHVILDQDPTWGSLIDNLHVATNRHRGGIGRSLMTQAAEAVKAQATSPARFLWVLQQNLAAQRFYETIGGKAVETKLVADPGGIPGRLNGQPLSLRMVWD